MKTQDNTHEEKPDPLAIALYYDDKNAPEVTASGCNEIAEEIIALAREHKIPIYENAELADLLSKLNLNEEIPEFLYLTIAEIIAFVYFLKGETPDTLKNKNQTY